MDDVNSSNDPIPTDDYMDLGERAHTPHASKRKKREKNRVYKEVIKATHICIYYEPKRGKDIARIHAKCIRVKQNH